MAMPIAITAQTSGTIGGVVYDDVNANGIYDKGDKPMKDVAVSDGLNVTKTDARGRYELPQRSDARFVSISCPSGYMTKAGGYYKAIAGKPASDDCDFAVFRYKSGVDKKGNHSFIQISDTEIFNTTGNEKWCSDVREYAANQNMAFVVHTGDICYEKGLKEHITLMNSDNMPVPVYYCIGNHDLVKGKYGEELYESIYGPTWYSFNVGNVHYVVTPMLGGDHKPSYNADVVCKWLRNDLMSIKPGTPVLVFNHDLLTMTNQFVYKGKSESLVLNDYNLKAWIYGHWHNNHITRQGNVLNICTTALDKGGIDHSVGAYRVLNVDAQGNLKSQLRYAYLHNHLAIASPQGETCAGDVTVNAYSSISNTASVTYSCAIEGKTVIKSGNLTQCSDWTWKAALPVKESWQGKKAELTVEARFADGTRATAKSEFVYNASCNISPDGNWDNLCGNGAHTGANTAVCDSTLQLVWTRNVGTNVYMTSPLIHDGKVIIATVDENLEGKCCVCAYDALTGEEAWRYATRHSVKNTIAIAADNVIAQDVLGNVYAIRCSDGSLAWQQQLPTPIIPALIDGVATEGNVAYVGTGKALTAIDAVTGKVLWQGGEWTSREGTTSTIAVGSGVLISGSQWSALYGNDAATGKLLWSHSQYGLRNRGASASIHGGLAYLVSDKSFFVIDARSGRIVVRRELPVAVDATSTPLLTKDLIVFGSSDKGIVAIDAQTHDVKWTKPVGKALAYSCPYRRPDDQLTESSAVAVGKMLFVASSDGCVYGLNLATGDEKWRYATGAPMMTSLAVSGNVLVACDYGGNLYLFANKL
ncbi:MAG: PQQ-binding-like beta-propeller repeat protein [Muribaculaceae bacterium]